MRYSNTNESYSTFSGHRTILTKQRKGERTWSNVMCEKTGQRTGERIGYIEKSHNSSLYKSFVIKQRQKSEFCDEYFRKLRLWNVSLTPSNVHRARALLFDNLSPSGAFVSLSFQPVFCCFFHRRPLFFH